jgi:hypothetical protein
MSIPPVNKPSDYDKFFSRYLADLSLQVKLNQENYDANVAFFKTGVQATERADTRSIEQRSTDVETLKIQARTMLNKLTDSNSASEVLTFLINNNLLFFFVQNFVDFERTINKRYPSQSASAPILRVLIQKSFDKQNDEIPLLKDELIVATNSVASRESIYNLLDRLYYTNFKLYEDLKLGLGLFPTLEEKINIVKFPEKKFKDETEINSYKDLPDNKQVQELADLYEQINTGSSQNIESTQNQINNLEESIETKMNDYLYTYMRIDNLETSKVKKQNKAQKEQEKIDKELFKGIDNRYRYNFDNMSVFSSTEKFKSMKPPISNTPSNKGSYTQEPIYIERTPAVFESKYYQEDIQKMPKAMIPAKGYVRSPPTKGSFKQKTISIQEPIRAEPVEEDFEPVLSKKVKSAKAKAPKDEISDALLQPYIDKMNFIKYRKDIDILVQKYKINKSEVMRQYGSTSIGDLKKVIAILQYNQANKYTTSPIEVQSLDSLNELTRGSYSKGIFIPDPTATKRSVSPMEGSPMEGTGLLTKRQQDSHRFKVLQGQILAGNNSKKIVMELKALILKMNKLGEISNKKATAVLQELNSVLK